MATREVIIPKSTWTLITIADCTFQCDCTMLVAESVSSPLDSGSPNKEAIRSKIYTYTRTDAQGLWGFSADGAIVTLDDEALGISEEYQGIARAINPNGGYRCQHPGSNNTGIDNKV